MRRLAILTFLTIDGVMQSPTSPGEDPSGDFTCGGWAAPHWSDVMLQVEKEAMSEPYDLLLGRKTYEMFAAHNISRDDEVSRRLNCATKFVATTTLRKLEWSNSRRITGDLATEVFRLKRQEGPLLQVHGSWNLIQTLLLHDLVDELRLWIFPVSVGSGGKRLFGNGCIRTDWKLAKTAAGPTGVLMCIYRRGARI